MVDFRRPMQSHIVTRVLIRSYGIPKGIGRYTVAQCYETWTTLAHSKIKWTDNRLDNVFQMHSV